MRASPARALRLLAAEALRDGLRRRLVLVVGAVAVLGLATAETCTSFGAGSFVLDGTELAPRAVAEWLAPVLYGFEALTLLFLAGLLAADHLVRPLEDGSAALWLARPVGRGTYAVARLAGALAVALGAGVLLLGGTAALLVGRHGLDAGPALAGALASALGAITVAALAMTASLALGRVSVVALVVTAVPMVALANGLAVAGARLDGLLGLVDRFAPPLGRSIFAAVAVWNPHVPEAGLEAAAATAQLALWAVASVGLLVASFRRVEIGA